MPLTTTSCRSFDGDACAAPAVWASAVPWRPNSAMATAVPINVDLAILMCDSPLVFVVSPSAACHAVAFPPHVPGGARAPRCTGVPPTGPVTFQYSTNQCETLYP